MAPGLLLDEVQWVLSGQGLLSPCCLAPFPRQPVGPAFSDEGSGTARSSNDVRKKADLVSAPFCHPCFCSYLFGGTAPIFSQEK